MPTIVNETHTFTVSFKSYVSTITFKPLKHLPLTSISYNGQLIDSVGHEYFEYVKAVPTGELLKEIIGLPSNLGNKYIIPWPHGTDFFQILMEGSRISVPFPNHCLKCFLDALEIITSIESIESPTNVKFTYYLGNYKYACSIYRSNTHFHFKIKRVADNEELISIASTYYFVFWDTTGAALNALLAH